MIYSEVGNLLKVYHVYWVTILTKRWGLFCSLASSFKIFDDELLNFKIFSFIILHVNFSNLMKSHYRFYDYY